MDDINEDTIRNEVRFETFTPGGPGGQHANRTSSAVRVVHLPTGISAVARDSRSQARNRELAFQRLLEKLRARHRPVKPRVPTKAPPQARAERRRGKEHRARVKEMRKKVEGE